MNKIYLSGSAKEVETKYGPLINLSLKYDELKAHVNEKGFVNITVQRRKEKGVYGDTHSMVINNWAPEKKPDYESNRPSISDVPW